MVKKGDIIINPKTNRPLRVGSRTWLKLVKEGIVEGHYEDSNELYQYEEGEDIESKKDELNENLPYGKQAVKGRGKYKNKLVVRNKRVNPKAIADYTRKKTIKVVAENMTDLENLTDAEIEEKLEELIMRQMLMGGDDKPKKRKTGKRKVEEEYYEIEDDDEGVEIDDDEDDDEDFGDIEW